MVGPRFTFRRMTEEDLLVGRRWLLEPHVRRWWADDPADTTYPETTLREWREAIRGDDPTEMFIAQMDGRPIGVIQSYVAQDYADHIAEVGELPERALELDLFIGEPALVGRGIGPAMLRAFLEEELARRSLEYCVIGPARANVPAIRAYEKVGFRYLREYREPGTTDPDHVLLDLRRADLA